MIGACTALINNEISLHFDFNLILKKIVENPQLKNS
jgi:hypothetical protein